MSRSQRDKGARGERELVAVLQDAGIPARRVPLSGAMKDTGFGGDVLMGETCQKCLAGATDQGRQLGAICSDCDGTGTKIGSEVRVEVKRRAQGFKRLEAWLEDAAVVAFRADHGEWMVCMRLADYLKR